MSKLKKAVVLSSGGLDSTTVLAIVKSQNFEIYAITFDYEQRHKFEIEAAKRISSLYDVKKHIIYNLDLRQFGGSALTANIDVPKDRNEDSISMGIPVTYVPARNTVFLSLALAFAETIKAYDIFIGVNAVDYSGYPDCRPAFIETFEKLANLGTKEGISGNSFKIQTPLINLTKAEIIKWGIELNVDYSLTSTCYSPINESRPCGHCDACILRLKGFKQAGIRDPLNYSSTNKNFTN